MFSNFSISFSSYFFFDVLSQDLIKHSKKKKAFVYLYINNVYNIYFRKLMNFCLTKKLMTLEAHLFDLV